MEQLEKTKYGKSYYAEIQGAEEKNAGAIWDDAVQRCQKMAEENNQLPEKVKAHTEGMIFPAIAVYQALLAADPMNAMRIMETAEDRVSLATGASYGKLLKFPFMRSVFLKIFSKGTRSGFSEDAGFSNHFICDGKRDIAFRIEKCPYHDFCMKYGCPELTHIFCHNDINAYGNLPGIGFERHETLGEGGTCCDFHLFLKK